MKRLCIASALLGLSLAPHIARGCSCAPSDPPSAFNGAKAVFIGQMLDGTEKLSWHDRDGTTHPIEAGHVRFAVEEVFKGGLPTETAIEIASMKGTVVLCYRMKEIGQTPSAASGSIS